MKKLFLVFLLLSLFICSCSVENDSIKRAKEFAVVDLVPYCIKEGELYKYCENTEWEKVPGFSGASSVLSDENGVLVIMQDGTVRTDLLDHYGPTEDNLANDRFNFEKWDSLLTLMAYSKKDSVTQVGGESYDLFLTKGKELIYTGRGKEDKLDEPFVKMSGKYLLSEEGNIYKYSYGKLEKVESVSEITDIVGGTSNSCYALNKEEKWLKITQIGYANAYGSKSKYIVLDADGLSDVKDICVFSVADVVLTDSGEIKLFANGKNVTDSTNMYKKLTSWKEMLAIEAYYGYLFGLKSDGKVLIYDMEIDTQVEEYLSLVKNEKMESEADGEFDPKKFFFDEPDETVYSEDIDENGTLETIILEHGYVWKDVNFSKWTFGYNDEPVYQAYAIDHPRIIVEHQDVDEDGEDEMLFSISQYGTNYPVVKNVVLNRTESGWKEMEIPEKMFSIKVLCGNDKGTYNIIVGNYGSLEIDVADQYREIVENYKNEYCGTDLRTDYLMYRFAKTILETDNYKPGDLIGLGYENGMAFTRNGQYEGKDCLIFDCYINGPVSGDVLGLLKIYYNYKTDGSIYVLGINFE